ncbi:MAG: DUF4142 domain-containing protein [Legionellaceae bacterium]|nr:DUF4142 domain-containing protein [Legionellaceae bacterium]
MKATKRLLGGVLGTCVLLTGCNTMNSPLNSVLPNRPVAPLAMIAQSNGNILSQLIVLNKSKIALAQLVKVKAQHPKVKRYAAYIEAEHRKILRKVMLVSRKTGIQPVMSASSQQLEMNAKQELANLRSLNGVDFDRAFINDSVKLHEAEIRLINQDIAESTNPRLTAVLKDVRAHVLVHLERAKEVQAAMNARMGN